jgi:hypothetical protein
MEVSDICFYRIQCGPAGGGVSVDGMGVCTGVDSSTVGAGVVVKAMAKAML